MGKQSYWSLLIFCAFLSHGFAILSNDNIEDSSSLHVRRKRVIDLTHNGGTPIPLFRARYIVNIHLHGIAYCAGTILDVDIIITTPYCINERPASAYTILSNSAFRNNGTPHHVVRRSSSPQFGFVLVKISPPIELHHGLNAKIDLFLGELPRNAYAYFSGWGCTSLDPTVRNRFPEKLMQTRLPIITFQECIHFFGGLGPDENHNICTFDASRRRSACFGDEGGPLVYEDKLIGILIYIGHEPWSLPNIFFNFNNFNIHNLVNFHMNAVRAIH